MKPECELAQTLLTQGEPVSERDAQFVAVHLAGCAQCRALENALETIALTPQDDDHFALDELAARRMVEAVLRQAPAHQANEEVIRPRRWPRVMGVMAAVLIAVIGGGAFLWRNSPGPAVDRPPSEPVVAVAKPVPEPKPHVMPEPEVVAAPKSLEAVVRSVWGRDERALGQKVREGEMIKLRASSLGLAVTGQAWVTARPNTEFRWVLLKEHDLRLALISGHLDVHVPHGQGIDLRITTPMGEVKVVGTSFSVEVTKAQGRVVVAEGIVQVTLGARRFRVTTGMTLGLKTARLSPASKAELTELRQSLAQEGLFSQKPSDEDGQLTVLSSRVLTVNRLVLGAGPFRGLVAPGSYLVSRPSAGGQVERTTAEVKTGRETVITDRAATSATPRADPAPRTSVELSPTLPNDSTETAEALLQQAQLARTQKDWRGAARAYEALIAQHSQTMAAEVARLSLGQLQVEHLGAPNVGGALCAGYVERNPHGALLAEAQLCQIRAFAALGQTPQELQAIDAFLKRWPDDFNAGPLLRRRAQLAPSPPP